MICKSRKQNHTTLENVSFQILMKTTVNSQISTALKKARGSVRTGGSWPVPPSHRNCGCPWSVLKPKMRVAVLKLEGPGLRYLHTVVAHGVCWNKKAWGSVRIGGSFLSFFLFWVAKIQLNHWSWPVPRSHCDCPWSVLKPKNVHDNQSEFNPIPDPQSSSGEGMEREGPNFETKRYFFQKKVILWLKGIDFMPKR